MIKSIAAGIVLSTVLAGSAFAETHEVLMLNRDDDGNRNVFEPAVIQIQPGDTVKWIPEDKGHNAQSIDGMAPDGGTNIDGKLNQEIEVTFDTEGTYGYKCLPHYATGMVGLVLVGDASVNFEEAKAEKHRGQAAKRFEEYFAQAEEMMQTN